MGYKIRYAVSLNKKYKAHHKSRLIRIVIFLIAIALFFGFSPIRGRIAQFLIPHDFEDATNAFSQLIIGIQNGQPMRDAVTSFYLEILEDV